METLSSILAFSVLIGSAKRSSSKLIFQVLSESQFTWNHGERKFCVLLGLNQQTFASQAVTLPVSYRNSVLDWKQKDYFSRIWDLPISFLGKVGSEILVQSWLKIGVRYHDPIIGAGNGNTSQVSAQDWPVAWELFLVAISLFIRNNIQTSW